jgi:hypothetical protein
MSGYILSALIFIGFWFALSLSIGGVMYLIHGRVRSREDR